MHKSGRLIILAGPSCVGKSPLAKALEKFYPDLAKTLQPLILYNSRRKRPGEKDGIDYHFRSRKEIENLRENKKFIVMEVRGDLQALDLHDLSESLNKGNVFFEGNPFIGNILLSHSSLKQVNTLSVFMAPLTQNEIENLKKTKQNISLSGTIKEIMHQKLLIRTKKQKGELLARDFEEIERRALSAYKELKSAHMYQYIIPNHDGEDSDNWNLAQLPSGDAGIALHSFIAILHGNIPDHIEKWKENLLP